MAVIQQPEMHNQIVERFSFGLSAGSVIDIGRRYITDLWSFVIWRASARHSSDNAIPQPISMERAGPRIEMIEGEHYRFDPYSGLIVVIAMPDDAPAVGLMGYTIGFDCGACSFIRFTLPQTKESK